MVLGTSPFQGFHRPVLLAGDTAVACAKNVFRPKQIELHGGGGTDMAAKLTVPSNSHGGNDPRSLQRTSSAGRWFPAVEADHCNCK
jgi:hypothetical protein